ncbi:PPM-type phosphatase domain-containing protein [Meloidogyne graminicola]|uniref:PPM-type phosphatase domain-containing protein n=1 Tax=Meloidogyne graminicola TaxID=189291 RepID=A0A8S9ZEA8_9BILA|nr:PPM-type phosphatase domain-containing protein [Meloidogyne graminicola]
MQRLQNKYSANFFKIEIVGEDVMEDGFGQLTAVLESIKKVAKQKRDDMKKSFASKEHHQDKQEQVKELQSPPNEAEQVIMTDHFKNVDVELLKEAISAYFLISDDPSFSRVRRRPFFINTNVHDAKGDAISLLFERMISRKFPLWSAYVLVYNFMILSQMNWEKSLFSTEIVSKQKQSHV